MIVPGSTGRFYEDNLCDVVIACWLGELRMQVQKSAHSVLMKAIGNQEVLKAAIIGKVKCMLYITW